MKILPTNKSAAICILALASLPLAVGQETEAEPATAPAEDADPAVEGEAHKNLSNIEGFIQSRLDGLAMADEERLYDPLGLIKDGAMEAPKEVVVETPTNTNNETPQPVNQLKKTVDTLVITGFNAGGGTILLGVHEIGVGQLIPGSDDIILSAVQSNKLTFKSKSSGETYVRPVGFQPGGVQSRNDFLDSIEGVNRR